MGNRNERYDLRDSRGRNLVRNGEIFGGLVVSIVTAATHSLEISLGSIFIVGSLNAEVQGFKLPRELKK